MDGLGPLWHNCQQSPRSHSSLQRAAEPTGSSPHLAVASAPWLLGDPTSVLSSYQEGGAVASPVVLLGLSHSGGPLNVWAQVSSTSASCSGGRGYGFPHPLADVTRRNLLNSSSRTDFIFLGCCLKAHRALSVLCAAQ